MGHVPCPALLVERCRGVPTTSEETDMADTATKADKLIPDQDDLMNAVLGQIHDKLTDGADDILGSMLVDERIGEPAILGMAAERGV
jgi:hypothetical protein